MELIREKKMPSNNFAENRYYRLEYIQHVSSHKSSKHNIATVTAMFSELADEFQSPSRIELACLLENKDRSTSHTFITEKFDISLFKVLVPGSIWKNGYRVFIPKSRDLVTITNSDQKIESLYEIASKFHPQKNQDIKIITLDRAEVNGRKCKVLIPTMEVIRYFYCGSQFLTTWLFNQPNGFTDLIEKFEISRTKAEASILASDKCKQKDARLLAWYETSSLFKKGANLIYSSIYVDSLNKNQNHFHIKSIIPINKKSDLMVDGELVTLDDNSAAYLVHRVANCNYSFDIDKVLLQGVKRIIVDDNLDRNPIFQASYTPKKRKCSQLSFDLTFNDTFDFHQPSQKMLLENDKFAGLENISIEIDALNNYLESTPKSEPIEIHIAETITKQTDKQIDCFRLKSPGLKPLKQKRPLLKNRIQAVLKAINTIKDGDPDIEIDFLPMDVATQEDSVFQFTEFGNTAWCYIEGRPRKGILARLKYNSKEIYILEIENRKTEKIALYFFGKPFKELEFNAQELLRSIVDLNGKRLKSTLFSRTFTSITRAYHTFHASPNGFILKSVGLVINKLK